MPGSGKFLLVPCLALARNETDNMTTIPPNAPPAFHLLAKPTGAVCNLDCTYCFFLSKEMLYPGSRFRMADEMLETYIRQLIEGHQVPHVNVAWQGGEPTLMGLDFFNRSIEYVEKYRKPGMSVEYTIQTNGTLIDDAWAAFFKTHNFLVGISIDGPRAMHDAYRVDKGGQPTFDKVMRGLSFLQKHGVEYNTLTTLHHANADHPAEVYRFLRDECGSRFHQFIPIIERVGEADAERADTPLRSAQPEPGQVGARQWTSWRDRPLYTQEGDYVTDRSVTAEQYGTFLIGVFEEWVRRDVGEVYVQMFDVALANWYGEPSGLCVHSKTCGVALAIEHNGDLYSCDHFVEPAYRLGNITETPMIELIRPDPGRGRQPGLSQPGRQIPQRLEGLLGAGRRQHGHQLRRRHPGRRVDLRHRADHERRRQIALDQHLRRRVRRRDRAGGRAAGRVGPHAGAGRAVDRRRLPESAHSTGNHRVEHRQANGGCDDHDLCGHPAHSAAICRVGGRGLQYLALRGPPVE